jgi:hypothetical protein
MNELQQHQERNKVLLLMAREQLMEDIDCIVDETFMEMFGWEDVDKWSNHKDKLTSILCDAICRNFPAN